jgi:hypothetical protein
MKRSFIVALLARSGCSVTDMQMSSMAKLDVKCLMLAGAVANEA